MARWLARDTFLSKSNMASTPVFTRLPQVISIEWSLSTEFGTFDDHDVTAGFVEKIPLSKDAGQITFQWHYDPENAAQVTIEDEYYNNMTRVPHNYKLTFNSTTATLRKIKTFAAYVGNWTYGPADANGKLLSSVTLEISGQPDSTGT